MIRIENIEGNKIVAFVMEGKCIIDEVVKIIMQEYNKIEIGILWDLSNGDISELSKDDMIQIARCVKEYAKHRKTAYLGTMDLEYGMLRMYEVYAKMQEVPPLMKVFRNRQDALRWIKSDTS